MTKPILLVLFGVVSLVGSAFADASFRCPKSGEEPRMSYAPTDGHGVIVCGNQIQGTRGGWARMNRFDVFTVGLGRKPKVLLHAEEGEYYNVWAGYDEGVILEKLEQIPLKDGEDPSYVAISRTKIKCHRRSCQRFAPVCAFGGVDKNTQADAVERAKAMVQKIKEGAKPDDKLISGRLLARALAGDHAAADLLKNFDTDLVKSDSEILEKFEQHQDTLKLVTRLGCLKH